MAVAPPAPLVAPGTLPGGANLVVKCRRSGQLVYSDVNPLNILYVLQNTDVDFKLEARNAPPHLLQLVNFGTAAWGGTATTVSAGGSKIIQFPTVSNANNVGGAHTVTIAFGGQNVTINCVVYSLQITSVPADNFGGRSQSHLGVDERVTLGFATTPAGVTALQAGGLQWKTVGAPSRDTTGVVHGIGGSALPVAQNGVAGYIAPCRTHTPLQPDVATKTVTLKLEVVTGPSVSLGPETTFTIHKPTCHMTVAPGRNQRHVNGRASAGFLGNIFFTPRDVSFRGLLFREGQGAMRLWPNPNLHFPNAWNGRVHPIGVVGAGVVTIGGGNSATGCQGVGVALDNVYSGSVPYVPTGGGSNTTVIAWQEWPIEWQYTYNDLVTGASANDWILMQKAYHKATLYESGRMVMFKGHIGCSSGDCMTENEVSKNLNDPTVP